MRNDDTCISLHKGNHRFLFRCCEGRESELLATFVDLAMSEETEFDWFDAAVLSYHMGRQAERHQPVS